MISLRKIFTPQEKKYKQTSLAGFSLAEILVAALVLTVAVSGVFATFIATKQTTKRAKVRIMAIHNAKYVLEHLREDLREDEWADAYPGNTLASGGPRNVTSWLPSGNQTFRTEHNGAAFYTVNDVVTPLGTYKNVQVVMTWRD